MARHMGHYFDLLEIPWHGWHRGDGVPALERASRSAAAVLLLIPDSAIADFVRDHDRPLGRAPRVHFSGSVAVDGVQCCHPLGSFGRVLHTEGLYRRIVFVCDPKPRSFTDLFPRLPNRYQVLDPELRPRYHALAVLSGNFTVLLWKKVREELAHMGLPGEATEAYMETVFENLRVDPEGSLTGPLSRGDVGTIRRNLQALRSDPFRDVYRAFVRAMGMEVAE